MDINQGQSLRATYDSNITAAQSIRPPQAPLTNEIMDALNRAQDIANEVRHRLFELRGRLIGHSPENGAIGSDPKAVADHFQAAHADRSAGLLGTLADIDRMSMDLANRL